MPKKEILIIGILLMIGIIRFLYFIPTPPSGYFDSVGKKVEFHGTVVDLPDMRTSNQRLIVKPKSSETNILVVAPNDIDIEYGDEIYVTGKLETPENFITNTGKEFNYERYLSNRDIYFIVQYAQVDVLSHDNGSVVKKYLFKLKKSFMQNINLAIKSPESDLAGGLLLGTKGDFDETTRNEFVTTGTIHIIALSGYNITIVASSVIHLFNLFFRKIVSTGLGAITIILFIIMAGSGASAVRSGVMACIALLGRAHGREYDAGRALVVAGLVMFAYDPRIITDISFQLSFLATFGILYITPRVISWVYFIPARFGLREIAGTTISAQIAVLPLLLYGTGVFSFVSFPANILILPFIPITMLASFVSGFAGFVSLDFAILFGYIAYIPLYYILKIIHVFASIPLASIIIHNFSIWITILSYLIIGWWIFRPQK
ncbi:MAG: ComEC/Rec2 family competence protein [Candidatus Pacebacteria bacterium]|nr:ComEC/Rec2 family competence protein [Candidatus Paceibacterota bacterium]MBP9716089.1 ComEC/Rec2 family competence protein [Candidatus Paceibacterota bacterium]